jgi:hypothetical protein
LRRRIALSTRFDAAVPYFFRPLERFVLLFRFAVAIDSPRIEVGVFGTIKRAKSQPCALLRKAFCGAGD